MMNPLPANVCFGKGFLKLCRQNKWETIKNQTIFDGPQQEEEQSFHLITTFVVLGP